MHDAALAWLPNVLGPVFVEKRAPVPKHERTWGGGAFYRIYRTQDDRHVVLGGAGTEVRPQPARREWGRPDLVELCERGPGPHQVPVVEFLQGMFATKTQAGWVEWFRGRDVCFAPVKNLREAFDDDHARSRGMHLVDELRPGARRAADQVRQRAGPGGLRDSGRRRAHRGGPARSRVRRRGARRAQGRGRLLTPGRRHLRRPALPGATRRTTPEPARPSFCGRIARLRPGPQTRPAGQHRPLFC